MKRTFLNSLLAVALASVGAQVNTRAFTTPPPAAQCSGTDRVITKPVKFGKGRTSTVIKDTVRLCTSHEYRLRARAGQTMTVHLATGRRTSFTVYAPNGDTPEGANGVADWQGELPESGVFLINVATDATAAYTLEITVR